MLVGYSHPEDEAEVFDAQGYYRTGDLGQWVDGDYLVISTADSRTSSFAMARISRPRKWKTF
jgi:non-ribosomal peptide synthetase component E (peptide arylation enzyme)